MMEQVFPPSQNQGNQPQIPLFIEGLPEGDKALTPKNIEDLDLALLATLESYRKEDTTITGPEFLKLYKRASSFGVTDSALKKYLAHYKVTIDSKNPPEEEDRIIYH